MRQQSNVVVPRKSNKGVGSKTRSCPLEPNILMEDLRNTNSVVSSIFNPAMRIKQTREREYF